MEHFFTSQLNVPPLSHSNAFIYLFFKKQKLKQATNPCYKFDKLMETRPFSQSRFTSVKYDKHQWRSEARQWSDFSPIKKNNIRTLTHVEMEWDFFLLSGAPAPPPRASLTIPHALSTFYISFYFTAAHSSKLNILTLTPPRLCQKSVRWTCATGKIQMESDKIQREQQLYEMLSKIMQCLHIKTP